MLEPLPCHCVFASLSQPRRASTPSSAISNRNRRKSPSCHVFLHGFRLLIYACMPARAGRARPHEMKPARALERLIEKPSDVAFAGINATLTRVFKSSLETVENHAYIRNYKLIVCRPNKKLAHNRKRNARRRRGNVSEKIQWAVNHMPKSDDKHLGIMSLENVKKARAFHKSFPQYTVTPLARLDGHGRAPRPRQPLREGRVLPLRPQRLQGPRRLLRHGQLHRRRDRQGRRRLHLRLPHLRRARPRLRPGDLLYRHRWQPRSRRGLGRQQARPEGRRAHAQGLHDSPASTTSPPRAPR